MHLKMALSTLAMLGSIASWWYDQPLCCVVLWLVALWFLSKDDEDPDGYT